MKNNKSRNGFTLIELIIVMVILGIMAAVAVPRYLDSISNAEEAAEDAVISAIRSGLTQYANNSLYESGRAEWPTNPFDALAEKPVGYSLDESDADVDGEWTFSGEELPIKELIIADMSGLTIQEHKVVAMMLLSAH